MLAARRETGFGRRRLALYLQSRGVPLSPHTIRHILRRHGLRPQRRQRRSVSPALGAWEVQEPFRLLQTDVKDIHDKDTLGTLHIIGNAITGPATSGPPVMDAPACGFWPSATPGTAPVAWRF